MEGFTGTTPPWSVGGAISGPRAASVVWLDWDEEEQQGHRHGFEVVTANLSRLVAIVPRGEGDADADARLIAAAPELLAVAVRCLNYFAGESDDSLRSLDSDLAVAIYKATGRPVA